VLVIACSDGRLRKAVDDFVQNHLGILDYDRLYAPGGPGALATSGFELLRSNTFRRDCTFLMEAHGVEHVILIFHGPAPGGLGPEQAACADYRRKLPSKTPDELSTQHETDTREVVRATFGRYLDTGRTRLSVYRAEVLADHRVRFVDLGRDTMRLDSASYVYAAAAAALTKAARTQI
jgi:hypothetical protein